MKVNSAFSFVHHDQLLRNCSSFSLKIEDEMLEAAYRDGDCLFRSLVRQARSLYDRSPELYQRWLSLSFELSPSSENQDILQLRCVHTSLVVFFKILGGACGVGSVGDGWP